MSRSLFDDDTQSTNEVAIVNLPVGRFPYTVQKAWVAKSQKGVNVSFVKEDTGTRHQHYFGIWEDGDKAKMSKQDMKALWVAMQLEGVVSIDRLPNFSGKRVEILIAESPNPNNPQDPYLNIKGIWPVGAALPTKPVAEQPAPIYTKDDELPQESAPAPAAAPAADKPVPSWKKRPQPAVAE